MLAVAVQDSTGASQEIVWRQADGVTPQDISDATLTGTIQPEGSPQDIRNISDSALVVADGPNGLFTWTYGGEDVETPGTYLVQFKADTGDPVLYSFVSYWIVEPLGGIHPYSLPALRNRLMALISDLNGRPTPYQYSEAVSQAVTMVSQRLPRKKQVLLNILSGTETYALPADFLFEIVLEDIVQPGGVGYSSSGKLIAFARDFEETHYVDGKNLVFVPTPFYTAQRRLWYGAGYFPDENQIYQGLAEDIAQIILLKAQELILRVQARDAGSSEGGFSYQLGDVRVDKKSKSTNFASLATAKETEYERAIYNKLGPTGVTA